MEKLISMTDFVLEQNKQLKNAPDAYDQYCKIVNQANFLSQTLNISMFVPAKLVDGVWVVLDASFYLKNGTVTQELLNEYETAKSNVLFEGFDYDSIMEYCYNNYISFDEEYIKNKTIEDLVKYELTLTTTAKKQIGL